MDNVNVAEATNSNFYENFKVLGETHLSLESKKTLVAEECSARVKKLTQYFSENDFPTVGFSWNHVDYDDELSEDSPEYIQDSYPCGIFYCAATKKILTWFDDPSETEVVLGLDRERRVHLISYVDDLLEAALRKMTRRLENLESLA